LLAHTLQQLAEYPGYQDQPLGLQAGVAAYYGKFASARDFTRRATDAALHSDVKDRAAWGQVVGAAREQFVGNSAQAIRQARGALAISKGRDVTGTASIIFALAGETSEATRLRDDLAKRYPEDTLRPRIRKSFRTTGSAASCGQAGTLRVSICIDFWKALSNTWQYIPVQGV